VYSIHALKVDRTSPFVRFRHTNRTAFMFSDTENAVAHLSTTNNVFPALKVDRTSPFVRFRHTNRTAFMFSDTDNVVAHLSTTNNRRMILDCGEPDDLIVRSSFASSSSSSSSSTTTTIASSITMAIGLDYLTQDETAYNNDIETTAVPVARVSTMESRHPLVDHLPRSVTLPKFPTNYDGLAPEPHPVSFCFSLDKSTQEMHGVRNMQFYGPYKEMRSGLDYVHHGKGEN